MVVYYRRLSRFEYLAPATLEEALHLLNKYRGRAIVVAGGTDVIPKLKRREIAPPEYIIDLKGVAGLDYITPDADGGLRIGALATISAVESAAIVRDNYCLLGEAARSMASPQVRNRGTIAGNIGSAVPSADMAPPLLVLEGQIELISQRGEKTVKIGQFFTGPGETVLADDELIREIRVPGLPPESRWKYIKLTPRRAMDLAVVGVAVVVVVRDGAFAEARIALGAVSPTPIRATGAEAVLSGEMVTDEIIEKAAGKAAQECRPISDHRASAEYRTEMVRVLTGRAIREAVAG